MSSQISRLTALIVVFIFSNYHVGFSADSYKYDPAGKELWQPYYITARQDTQHIVLEGNWKLGYRDEAVGNLSGLEQIDNWVEAPAARSIHWSLYDAGKLPHPYHQMNGKLYEWVEEKFWYYRKTFEVPASASENYVMLCFDGVDYFSRFWLNGELLGKHMGMNGGPAVEVSKHVKFGQENELVVEVVSANYGIKDTYQTRAPGKIIRPWALAGGVSAEPWFTVGLWRPVRIEIMPKTHMERPFLITREADEKTAKLELNLEVLTQTHSLKHKLHSWTQHRHIFKNAWTVKKTDKPIEVKFELIDKSSGQTVISEQGPVQINVGRNWIKQDYELANPSLWWPNGMGQSHLYRAEITLLEDEKPVDFLTFDYGIRTIEERPSAGPRTHDIWADWQFVVNGKPFFAKGMNWMPMDILLKLEPEKYRWLLEMARDCGIQILRVWGSGIFETDDFYRICDELGLMVWQDFPIANMQTAHWPQAIWEEQVVWNILRVRNHPSLVMYCGGNEFNSYASGSAASVDIIERSVKIFDNTRWFRRSSPDGGSSHVYPIQQDPTWYRRWYRWVPFFAETGAHCFADAKGIREYISEKELADLGGILNMKGEQFRKAYPQIAEHTGELDWSGPAMRRRSSHIDDISSLSTIESLAEASQIGVGEFYQIFSEIIQNNYPVTTGLLPWTYNRPWYMSSSIMFVDGFGQPVAPYYFLKRTYEPTHITVQLDHSLWAKGEDLPISISVIHAPDKELSDLTASVTIMDKSFNTVFAKEQRISVLEPGPSVLKLDVGSFTIPESFDDSLFFVVAELKEDGGRLVSRSVYWPRCLSMLSDAATLSKYRKSPQLWPDLKKGPWLKKQVTKTQTQIQMKLISRKRLSDKRSSIRVSLVNSGSQPAFPIMLEISGAKRVFYATDNFFWLAPKEERILDIEVKWREPIGDKQTTLEAWAWNAQAAKLSL